MNEGLNKKDEFPVLKTIKSIGKNEGVKKIELPEGWKRFFENENYQMMFKIKDFTTSGITLDVPTPPLDIFKGTKAEAVGDRNPEIFKPRSISVPGAKAPDCRSAASGAGPANESAASSEAE